MFGWQKRYSGNFVRLACFLFGFRNSLGLKFLKIFLGFLYIFLIFYRLSLVFVYCLFRDFWFALRVRKIVGYLFLGSVVTLINVLVYKAW